MKKFGVLLIVLLSTQLSFAGMYEKAIGIHESTKLKCQVLKNKVSAKLQGQGFEFTTASLLCGGKSYELHSGSPTIEQALLLAQSSGKFVELTYSDMAGDYNDVIMSLEID